MIKKAEIKEIKDFIKTFNREKLGLLKLTSGEKQENPDAVCILNNEKKIGIEATIVMLPEDEPFSKKKKENKIAYNPHPVIDILFNRIRSKSLNDYKEEDLNEVWLLIIGGGSYISDHDLNSRLKDISGLNTKFQKIFIHKSIYPNLIEIV